MASVVILQRVVPHYRVPLFRRLHQRFGWQVACARVPPTGTFLEVAQNEPFVVPLEFKFPDPRNQFRAQVPVSEMLSLTGAQAIIAEFSLNMTSTYELVARRRLCGGPVTLFWSHGYNMDRGLGTARARLLQMPAAVLHRMADGVVCYSQEGKAYLERHLDPSRILVARNTIDVTPMQSLALKMKRLTRLGRPSLLTIGRMTPDKDFPRLVRVFLEFRNHFPGAVLTVIGEGPDADRTRTAAGGELGKSIVIVGAEYDEQKLARLFCASDVVVFPGAVGLSVNHALAYGVPVIAFDRTQQGPHHHPEIAYVVNGVTGYRVPSCSDTALLEALCEFFAEHKDPKADFGESIRQYVAENLTIDVMVEDFQKVHEYLRSLGIDSGTDRR